MIENDESVFELEESGYQVTVTRKNNYQLKDLLVDDFNGFLLMLNNPFRMIGDIPIDASAQIRLNYIQMRDDGMYDARTLLNISSHKVSKLKSVIPLYTYGDSRFDLSMKEQDGGKLIGVLGQYDNEDEEILHEDSFKSLMRMKHNIACTLSKNVYDVCIYDLRSDNPDIPISHKVYYGIYTMDMASKLIEVFKGKFKNIFFTRCR